MITVYFWVILTLSETGFVHDYCNFLSNYGFTSLVNESTRIVANSKT